MKLLCRYQSKSLDLAVAILANSFGRIGPLMKRVAVTKLGLRKPWIGEKAASEVAPRQGAV